MCLDHFSDEPHPEMILVQQYQRDAHPDLGYEGSASIPTPHATKHGTRGTAIRKRRCLHVSPDPLSCSRPQPTCVKSIRDNHPPPSPKTFPTHKPSVRVDAHASVLALANVLALPASTPAKIITDTRGRGRATYVSAWLSKSRCNTLRSRPLALPLRTCGGKGGF